MSGLSFERISKVNGSFSPLARSSTLYTSFVLHQYFLLNSWKGVAYKKALPVTLVKGGRAIKAHGR